MTIPVLVTLDQVVAHLKIPAPVLGSPPSAEQLDLQQKLDAATQLVCEHIADRQPPDDAWVATIEAWTTTTAPPLVALAVLELTSYVTRYRGDDGWSEQPMTPGYLPTPVMNLLVRYRSPVLA